MIRLEHSWPQSSNTNKETWKDAQARAGADAAAKAIEQGDLCGCWGSNNVQIGENRNAELAKRAAGSLVENAEESGD